MIPAFALSEDISLYFCFSKVHPSQEASFIPRSKCAGHSARFLLYLLHHLLSLFRGCSPSFEWLGTMSPGFVRF